MKAISDLNVTAPLPEELNILVTLFDQGHFKEGEALARSLTIRFPDHGFGWKVLGAVLKLQGRTEEAVSAMRRAVIVQPDDYPAWSNLGLTLMSIGMFAEAEKSYRAALALNANLADAQNNLGIILKEQGQFSESEACYRRALEIKPDYIDAHNNLGNNLQNQGRFYEAEDRLRLILELKPDYVQAYSNLLFLLNYDPDKSGSEIYEEYKRFDAQFGLPLQGEWQPHCNSRESNRRLKVGYISGDFTLHPVRHFLEPLLAHHNKAVVEIYAYADVAVEDAMTARYRELTEHWILAAGMTDAELASRIHFDYIDILVDLSGHTAKNRLGVFARKPAPVSISWLGYGYTTGLTAIDYFLTDPAIVPPGSEDVFSEIPWRLATPSFAYRPAEGMGEVSPLPAKERGYMTFGTLTRAIRINHRSIRVWSEILKRVPGSHLVINSGNFRDPEMQSRLAEKFMAQGIARERLEIGCTSPPWDVLRGLDIGLDCFPHNSGTTLFESLYMGVPFITLAGRPSVGRLGACILEGVGHGEWIAGTEDDYIERAVSLASDLPRLEVIRTCLRGEMESSPLMDEPGFVRKVEAAYREMFTQWCEDGRTVNNQEESMTGKEDTSLPFDEMLQQAFLHHQAGQLQEAERLYLKLLQAQSDHSIINYNLGLLAVQMQHPAAGLPYFEAALDVNPEDGGYWLSYIDALGQSGKTESARQILEVARSSGLQGEEVNALSARLEALQGNTTIAQSAGQNSKRGESKKKDRKKRLHKATGGRDGEPKADEIERLVVLFTQDRYEEAEILARSMIMRFPGHGFAWKVLGVVLKQLGRPDEALSAMQQSVNVQPDDYVAQNNLGLMLMSIGLYAEAEQCYRTALLFNADLAEAQNNLGIILKEQGRPSEAEICYHRALELKPDYAEAYYNLGNTLQLQGRLSKAEECFRQAVRLNPDFAEAYNNLCINLQKQGRLSEAETCCAKALMIRPDYAEAYSNLGITLQDQGRSSESEAQYRRALELKPDYPEAFGNLLFLLNYDPDKSGSEIYEEYKRFDAQFGLPLQGEWQPHCNSRESNRRLKVGYISGDFTLHPVRHFLEPLLAHHNKAVVEIYAYADVAVEDAMTARYRELTEHWILAAGMTDAELASRIHFDYIDILVDLSGHTAKNRLGVFARKPAPVSISWLGYGYTTGLTAIDYFLTDPAIVPPGSEDVFSEIPWRLATPSFAYRPAEGMGEVSPLPAKERGYMTFGTLTRAIRINHRSIRVWSEILKRVPGSHLVINSGNFRDPEMQSRLAEKFMAQGIARERLEIGCTSPPWDVLRGLDIGLDCFPHNSGTTLFESLYMGVPFITLAGRPSVGRLGACILEGVGHGEWIAGTEDDYIERAVSLASDLPRLEVIRTCLRGEMESSPLMDEPGFVRKVEAAYREMFTQWCEDGRTVNNQEESMTGKEDTSLPFDEMLQQAFLHHQAGQLQEAERLYLKLLQAQSDHSIINYNLGIIYQDQGKYAEAEASYRRVLELHPEYAEVYNNLGNTLKALGKIAEAETSLRSALRLKPEYAESYNNLGNILHEQGRLNEAETCYQKALTIWPDFVEVHSNLGSIFSLQGRLSKAEECFRQAVRLNPDFAEAYNNLCINLQKQGRLSEAETCCAKALMIRPDYAEAYSNLGITLQDQGRSSESEAQYRRALELKPDYPEAFGNLLFLLNYDPDKSGSEIYEEYKRFDAQFGLPLQGEWQPHCNSRESNRRLKVGYISGDFTLHPVRHFLEPLLAHHNKAVVEIYAYADVAVEDAMTARYRELTEHWILAAGMTDAELASRIHFDYIDILVDLSGHTAKNRLGVFARKPAPVSISWLGYGYTTGLTAIDYFLTDPAIVPPGSEDVFSEIPWRLATPSFAYRPAEGMGEVSPLPAKERGYMTFGTLTRAIRINHRSIRVWSEILKRVPGSHLVINSGNFRDPEMQSRLAEKFMAQGIARERLEIGCTSPPWDVLRGLDIGLDCFPHNSGTTLFESLYMGVPFITLAGRPSVGRLGACILEGVGHGEWIAGTEDDYIERAVSLASDLPRLEVIRTCLRGEMESSPLMDEPGFVRKVEAAYREMFTQWCEDGRTVNNQEESMTGKEDTSLPFDEMLQQAFLHHQAGQLQEAERLYLKLLQAQSDHSIINYNLGLLAVQMQHPAAGLPYFEAALDVNPEDGGYWLSYIDALGQSGKTESARQILEVARSSGLQGEEVNALSARLEALQGNTTIAQSAGQNSKRGESKKKDRKKRLHKATGGRDGEPKADEIERLVVLFTQDRYEEAEILARSMIMRFPGHGFAWKVLGPILQQLGRTAEGFSAMQQAVELLPNDVETHYNLGIVCQDQGKYAEAEACYRRVLQFNPEYAEAYNNLGNTLKTLGRIAEAESNLRLALKLKPDFAEAYNNLGNTLKEQGRIAEAEENYRLALKFKPDYVMAYSNLGNILKDQMCLIKAEACYRSALALKPNFAEVHYNLGNTLRIQGRLAESEAFYCQALKLKPGFTEAYNNLGVIFKEQGLIAEAEESYNRALELNPQYAEAHSNIGSIFSLKGHFLEAEKSFRRALELKPDYPEAFGNLLFLLNYDPDKSGSEIYEEYKRFDAQFGLPLQGEWQPHCNSRESNRRLKVGYISGDFTLHPVRHFLEPLLAHHNKAVVEIYAYADVAVEDAMTARYRELTEHWILAAGMTDAELASRIHFDYIDILVDLSGHTAKNRLGVFARKPAPVSISWLGYGYTTGLTAIDYFLTDPAIVPPGSEDVFSEIPWRLATPSFAYRPAEGMGEVSPLPAKERGYMTFGTLTRAIRINHRSIRVWSEILKRVPGSHLVINSGNFRDPEMQSRLAEKFMAQGIARERLEIGCTSPPWDVLRGLDIGLDCFPHNSGTTLFESLYMGVPFITLAGRPSVGRLGACILEGVGHGEWIAGTEDDYIERAVSLASDLPRLEVIRTCLRGEMESSPLMDEPGFVRKVEAAYREMFTQWCEGQQ